MEIQHDQLILTDFFFFYHISHADKILHPSIPKDFY